MKHILQQIVETKLNEIQLTKQLVSRSEYVQSPLFNREIISLKETIQNVFGVIAEIKRKSPGAGEIRPELDILSQVAEYESHGATAISVLTDFTYFGGSIADLKEIRNNTSLPILRKEFILDEYQLFESKAAGADAVLLIAAILTKDQAHQLTIVAKSLGLEVLFEIHTFDELDKLNDEVDILLVNNRNLKTQQTRVEHSFELAAYLPENPIKISASGISSSDQLKHLQQLGYNGALIGESLLKERFAFDLSSKSLLL